MGRPEYILLTAAWIEQLYYANWVSLPNGKLSQGHYSHIILNQPELLQGAEWDRKTNNLIYLITWSWDIGKMDYTQATILVYKLKIYYFSPEHRVITRTADQSVQACLYSCECLLHAEFKCGDKNLNSENILDWKFVTCPLHLTPAMRGSGSTDQW